MDIKLFKKSLASKSNPSLLKEDLKNDLKQFGGATGGWIKYSDENISLSGSYVALQQLLSQTKRDKSDAIYYYDDEEGGLEVPGIAVAKVGNNYAVISDNDYYTWTIKIFSTSSAAVKFAASQAGLERI